MKRIFFLSIIAFLCVSSLQSQNFSGTIIDKEGTPVEYANIVLLNFSDSSLIQGMTSSQSGTFHFEDIAQHRIFLKISCLGYLTKWFDVEIHSELTNLGSIVLEQDITLLKDVTITTSSPPFVRNGNSLITNVKNSILSSVGTANDVIKQIPGVLVKGNEITVFSKGYPIIYINNRKLYDASELQRLKSADINTIELITSPGAKYDAEGRAVLLIKTNQKKEEGWAVQISETLVKGHFLNDQEDVGLSYTHNNLYIFTSYNHYTFKQNRNPMASYSVYADTLWQQFVDIPQTYHDNVHQITFGTEWSIASKQTIGGQYQGTIHGDKASGSGLERVLTNGQVFDVISTKLNSTDKPVSHLLNMFYEGYINESLQLHLNVDYLSKHNRMNQKISESSSIEDREVTISNQSDYDLYANKLTFDYLLGDAGNLEFGGEYNYITGSGLFDNPEQYIENNIYTNLEEKTAIFLGYNRPFGKWQFQTGIRYEYTFIKSTEDSVKRINTDRSFHRFYPSFSLSRTFENNTETGLSFARRIKRPSFSQLNSNNYYINRFLLQKGNPMLINEDIYQVDSYLRYKIFDFNLGYVYKKNPIGMNIESNHLNSGQTVITYTNYPKYQEINALLTGNLKYKIIRSRISTGLQQPFFNINYQGIKQNRNQISFLYEMNNDVVLPKDYIFSLNFVYQGKNNEYAMEKGEYKSLDINFRKSFFEKKLSVNFQILDVFGWVKDKTMIETNNVSYIQRSKYETRFLILTLNYRFNNYRNKYKGKNVSEDDIRRL